MVEVSPLPREGIVELVKLDNDAIQMQVLEALTVIIYIGKGYAHWVRDMPTGLGTHLPSSYLPTFPYPMRVCKLPRGQSVRRAEVLVQA